MVRRPLTRPVRHRPILLSALLPVLLITGCGSSGPPVTDAFFTLQPALLAAPAPGLPASAGNLQVAPLAARGFLGGTQIVFRTAAEPLQAQRYDNLMWDQPPGRTLAAALAEGLRTGGAFAFVLGSADRARADFLLVGELTRLEHLPTSTPPRVAAAWTLTLLGAQDRRPRFSQAYAGEEPTGESTPAAMVLAFNRLTGRLLSAAVADLQGLHLSAAPVSAR
ncbi:MAG: hypothetical protein EA400_17265 [Chromatiaceae bacterium]|nr:MAG: hypothetical protein EA400_17265 [Chromatiaceae bacterium]